MKLHKALAAAALTAACIIPFSGLNAGAAGSTSLTVVDADQYSGTNLLSHTICVDDVLVQSGDSVINPAITTTPGTHTVKVASGPYTDDPSFGCDADVDWATGSVDLADVEAQTLVYEGVDHSGQTPGLTTTLITDDMSCTKPDTSRIVVRNFNSRGLTVNFGSSDGADPNPELTPLVAGLAAGDEATAVVAAGTFPAGSGSVAAGWVDDSVMPFPSDFDSINATAGSVTFVYAVGGGDGPIGQYAVTTTGSVCEGTGSTTTTTTIPATTPTTVPAKVAPAAKPVTAQPVYTG